MSLSLRDDQFLLKLKGKVPILTCLTILILKLDVDTVKIANIVDTMAVGTGVHQHLNRRMDQLLG